MQASLNRKPSQRLQWRRHMMSRSTNQILMEAQIKVWGTDGIQTDVTSYDGNNQYVKEVTEGEDFNFQITRNDGFEIENVTVNGAHIAPESTDGNVSTYKLSGVAEEKAITITYNKGRDSDGRESGRAEQLRMQELYHLVMQAAEQGGQQS